MAGKTVKKVIPITLLIGLPILAAAHEGTHMRQPHLKSPMSGYKIPFRPNWVSVVKQGRLFKYKRKEYSSPIVQDDLILLGADNGQFYGLNRKSGRKLWRFKAQGSINSVAASDGEKVFFGDDKGHLYAVQLRTGKKVWERELGAEILSAPAIGPGRLFVATLEGNLLALNREDGGVIWSVGRPTEALKMTIRGNSPPVLDESGNLYIGYADGLFQALRARDGKILWEKNYATAGRFGDLDAAPLVDGDRIYLAAFDGPFMAVQRRGGRVIWKTEFGTGVAPAIRGDRIYVADSRGSVRAIRREDGALLWSTKIGEGSLTTPVLHEDVLAVGLSNSTMNFVDAANGKVMFRRFARKGISSDPLLVGDRLYYFSNGGRLYSLKMVNP